MKYIFYRGSTPTLTLTLPQDVDLTLLEDFYLTFRQNASVPLELPLSVFENNTETFTMTTRLTEEQTLAFNAGKVDIQGRFLFNDGASIPSEHIVAYVGEINKDGEISI